MSPLKITLVLLGLVAFTFGHGVARAEEDGPPAVPAGALFDAGETQLFVDDFVIDRMSGVTRELGTVAKANGGRPLSFWCKGSGGERRPMPVWQLFHTVYHDSEIADGKGQGIFRLWCRGLPGDDDYHADGTPDWNKVRYVYCESTDGVNFDFIAELQGLYSRGDFNLVVTYDDREPDPEHRYRIGYDGGRPELPNGACLAHSADGIHWTPYNDGRPVTGRAADFSNQVFWDRDAGLYRLFTRTDFGAAGGLDERRGVRMMTNPDLKRDPAGWTTVREWQFDREGPQEWKRRQPYMMTDWIRHRVHFALMSVYEWPTDYSEGTETDPFTRHERDVNNVYIATSRDADDWDLRWVYEEKHFIPRGGNGAWDKDLLFPSSRIVTLDDKHWIYYGGSNERHGTPGVCLPRRGAGIGLVWLRLDGFIALAAGDAEGTVVTKPFRLAGRTLQVNVDARRGEAKVGVLDAEGRPIAGYTLDEAHGYRGRDELRLEPRWKDRPDLQSLQGREIRLQFQLRNASLYSFQVR